MKSPIRFIPNIKVVRRVWKEEGILRIELGKFWEIRLTRALQEDMGYAGPPYDKENKGFTKHIKDGYIIPRWYGFAYHDFDTDTTAYMPIPINLIYAVLRWTKYNMLRRVRQDWPRWLMLWEKRIYRLGQLDGYKIGRSMRVLMEGDLPEPEVRRMLDGVDPHTNPGWTKNL